MARTKNSNREKAFELYKENNGNINLVEIASRLNIPEGTVRSWKSRYKWDSEINATLQNSKRNVARKKGGQPGNTNATGPPGNSNAERHGLFAKWLPEETAEIMGKIQSSDPLDLLWDNIQLQYTAIIRAQKLMYVKDQEDSTTTQIQEKHGDNMSESRWEVQQAWDKHATFLNAQSRAMKTLESMIKQYDELIHKDWELATEEQKTRIVVLKAKANLDDNGQLEDDGFLDALKGKVDEIWQDE